MMCQFAEESLGSGLVGSVLAPQAIQVWGDPRLFALHFSTPIRAALPRLKNVIENAEVILGYEGAQLKVGAKPPRHLGYFL